MNQKIFVNCEIPDAVNAAKIMMSCDKSDFGSLFNLLLVLSLPKRIRILTDDNELELVQKVMLSKIPTGKYEYVISITKKGMELLLTEAEIEKYVSVS